MKRTVSRTMMHGNPRAQRSRIPFEFLKKIVSSGLGNFENGAEPVMEKPLVRGSTETEEHRGYMN